MENAVTFLVSELSKVRTGRATTGLVENVLVDVYGSKLPLKQLATISVADTQKLLVQPFDVSTGQAIAKAILDECSLNTDNQGASLFITVPEMDGTRRDQMKKKCSELSEDTKIKIRNTRKTIRNNIKSDDTLTEDEKNRYYTEVDNLTAQFTSKADKAAETKMTELSNI